MTPRSESADPAGQRLGAALLLLVLIGGLVAWQVLAGSGSAGGKTAGDVGVSARPGRFAPVVKQASLAQTATFRLLRTPAEGLPTDVTRSLHKPTFGLNWKLAQRLPATGGFWAVPGRNALCIVGRMEGGSVSVNCGTTRHVVTHGVAAVQLRGSSQPEKGQRSIVGLAPDGAVAVRIYTHQYFTTVPVKDTVFVLRDSVMDPPDRYEPIDQPQPDGAS
jgi:hypothetical protein